MLWHETVVLRSLLWLSPCQRYLWLGMFEDSIVQEVMYRMIYSL